MPAALIAALPAIISAGTAATEIGIQASGAFQPSGGDAKKQQMLDAQKQQQQNQTMEQSMFKHAAPDVQGQVGGSLTDPGFAAMIAEYAGLPGNIGSAQSAVFGNSGNPNGPFDPTSPAGPGGTGLASTSVG